MMDTAAEVTVEQRFENKEAQPIEVEYEFKINSKKVAVTKFIAFIDGKKSAFGRLPYSDTFHSFFSFLRSQGYLEGERASQRRVRGRHC